MGTSKGSNGAGSPPAPRAKATRKSDPIITSRRSPKANDEAAVSVILELLGVEYYPASDDSQDHTQGEKDVAH